MIVLGFDFGEKRIGLAVGNGLTGTSRALGWLNNDQGLWPALDETVARWEPQCLLVGVPLTLEGGKQPLTRKARHFAARLREHFGLPVNEVDERLSSASAERELAEARASGARPRRLRRGDSDSMAAALLVQQWLDAA